MMAVLKIIASSLLMLLAFILVLLLLLLFVPFRYRLNGSFRENIPDGEADLSWFLRFIRLHLQYNEGVLVSGGIYVLGFLLFQLKEKDAEPGADADETAEIESGSGADAFLPQEGAGS